MKTTYFSIEQFFKNSVAERNGIDNKPTEEIIDNIVKMINFLDEMKESWGNEFTIKSGYKCTELISLTGDDPNSAHLTGNAIDIEMSKDLFDDFIEFFKDYLLDKRFDECKIEEKKIGKSQRIMKWIHFALFDNEGNQREIFQLPQ